MTKLEPQRINVLDDNGYVILHDVMGSDLTVVNAARVSFDRKSQELTDKDRRLIAFLAEHGHTSPARHAFVQFEINAPLMICRQWWKYVVASDHTMDAHNESSRRYVTESCEFYVPSADKWRSAPSNRKQGSGENLPAKHGVDWTEKLRAYAEEGLSLYETAMAQGICAEQARLFLPAYGMYVKWYWSTSLQSVCNLLNQRLAHDAQAEFQQYAKAVLELVRPHFPESIAAFTQLSEEGSVIPS